MQAADLFIAKVITAQQHDDIQDDIRAKRDDFGEEAVDDSDQTKKELSRVFAKAVALGLTTKEAVGRMERHIDAGRFSPEHYLEMWVKRIEDTEPTKDVAEVDEKEFTLNEPSGWPTSRPSIAFLNRMKKAELVALAKERGVSHSGTKAKIIDALREEE